MAEMRAAQDERALPNDWYVIALRDIADVVYGKAVPRTPGDVPIIGSGGVYGHTEVMLVREPTIVIGRKGTAGSVYLTDGPSYPSDTTFFLRWKVDHDPEFVYHAMSLNKLSGEHAKTTLPSLKRPDLESLMLPWPPLPEQQAIASVLRAVQHAKEVTEKVIAATRELERSLLRHLFTYGPVRIHEAENVPLKETEIGLMPEHWEILPLGYATDAGGGSIQTGPFGSLLHAHHYLSSGTPVVMPKDLSPDGKIILNAAARVGPEDATRLSRYRLEVGDLLVARRGELGRRGLVTAAEAGSLCGTGCLRIRPGIRFVSRFVSYAFDLPRLRAWLESNAVGTTMANLSTQILARMPIPVPSPDEQTRIADLLDIMSRKIASEERRAQAGGRTHLALLTELMTGRRRVRHPEVA